MRNFLDSNTRRKVELLITLNKEDGLGFEELSRRLHVSRPTIFRDVEEIQEKFQEWQLTEAELKTRKATVYFVVNTDYSIHQIFLNYLEENLNYQALVEIFHSGSINLKDFAKKHFVSYNSLYKKLSSKNKLLKNFDLKFVTNKQAELAGNERQLRFFYSEFFWYSYSGIKWPFPNISRQSLKKLINPIELIRGKKLGFVEKEKILYDLAVFMSRIQQGHFIPTAILRHEILKDNPNFDYFDQLLKPLFAKFVPKATKMQVKSENAFLYVFLFAEEYHLKDNKTVGDLLFYCQTHQLQAVEITNQWFQMVYQNFSMNASAEEYSLLYTNLVHKHVKALTFKGAGSLSGIDLSSSIYLHPEVTPQAEYLFKQLYERHPILLKNKDFLEENYRFLIGQYIKQKRKNLSICVLSVFGEEFTGIIKHRAFQGMDIDVDVSGTINKDTDLVVTDRKYEHIDFDPKKILYWESIPTKQSIFRIQNFIHQNFGFSQER